MSQFCQIGDTAEITVNGQVVATSENCPVTINVVAGLNIYLYYAGQTHPGTFFTFGAIPESIVNTGVQYINSETYTTRDINYAPTLQVYAIYQGQKIIIIDTGVVQKYNSDYDDYYPQLNSIAAWQVTISDSQGNQIYQQIYLYGAPTYGAPTYSVNCEEDVVQFSSISVPVFSGICDQSGNPVDNTQTVQVIQGTEASELLKFQRIAAIEGSLGCDLDAPACPDGWQIRPEYQRPQAIYQFAEVDNSGNIVGAPMYRITIPHHLATKPINALPNYQRGNWLLIYVLNDNSRVTIHAFDETNATNLLNAIKQLIDPTYLTNAYLARSSIVNTASQIKQITVKNRMAKFWSQGAKNELPDWVKKW